MINNYNPILTAISQSNTDIQLITSGNAGLSMIHYICNYITKNSTDVDSWGIIMRTAKHKTMTTPLTAPTHMSSIKANARDLFIRFSSELTKCTQIAATEVSTKLIGLKMCYSSSNYSTINLYGAIRALDRYRLETTTRCDEDDMDFTDFLALTLQACVVFNAIEHYVYRDVSLEFINWYDFSAYLALDTKKERIFFPHGIKHRYYNKGGMTLRPKVMIPVVNGNVPSKPDNQSSNEEQRKYNETINMLFKPWRTFDDIIGSGIFDLSESGEQFANNFELLRRSSEEASLKKNIDHNRFQYEPNQDFNDDRSEDDPTISEELSKIFAIGDIDPSLHIPPAEYIDILNSVQALSQNTPNTIPKASNRSIKYDPLWKEQLEAHFLNLDNNRIPSINVNPETLLLDNIQNDLNQSMTQQIISMHTLNLKQAQIFTIVSNSIISLSKRQMNFYIGGEGGTGKSRIIIAITELFKQLNQSNQLMKMSFTGTAAYNIGGVTIHSALNATIAMKFSKSDKIGDQTLLYRKWKDIKLIIIDEVSFCPGKLVTELDRILRIIHKSTKPYGGIHILFFGDFYQHVSIAEKIYDNDLWKTLNGSIILTEQMRAREDPQYIQFLQAVRERNVTDEDIEYLTENMLYKQPVDFLSDEWFNAPFLSTRKGLVAEINNVKCHQYALKYNAIRHVISSCDLVSGQRVSQPGLRKYLIKEYSELSTRCKLQRVLQVCIGSSITLTSNILHLSQYGLTNGSRGTVYAISSDHLSANSIVYDEDSNSIFYTRPPVIFFKPDYLDPRLEQFKYNDVTEPGVFPIHPIKHVMNVKFKLTKDKDNGIY